MGTNMYLMNMFPTSTMRAILTFSPSYYETKPLSVMEAMACWKTVVAIPVGDVRLLVENGVNGFLVPTNDVIALVERIIHLTERLEIREKIGKKT
jgi:glycosyltransferase involved in cell wall biosynthesis